jgi:hypothetical protein
MNFARYFLKNFVLLDSPIFLIILYGFYRNILIKEWIFCIIFAFLFLWMLVSEFCWIRIEWLLERKILELKKEKEELKRQILVVQESHEFEEGEQ